MHPSLIRPIPSDCPVTPVPLVSVWTVSCSDVRMRDISSLTCYVIYPAEGKNMSYMTFLMFSTLLSGFAEVATRYVDSADCLLAKPSFVVNF